MFTLIFHTVKKMEIFRSAFAIQLVIFEPLSYYFEETIGFDVKALFASHPVSCLIRWYKKRKVIQFQGTFHILKITDWIFCNPFHCRFKESITFIIVSFLWHCPPYSVFLCACNINFEEIFLYSMMLNL